MKRFRLAFLVSFGLTVFVYFLEYLRYFIDFEIESITAYMTFLSVLGNTEMLFAALTGLLLVFYSFKKAENMPVKSRISEYSQA
ncbi:MAG: hypothetical protein ACTSQF_09960 [Candidatus Heimdallarchaeaceae archaeon]